MVFSIVILFLPIFFGDIFCTQIELGLELRVGGGEFEGREVFALSIFDDGELEAVLVVDCADDGGDGFLPGEDGGAITAFAGDDEIFSAGGFRDDDGLEDAGGFNGLGEEIQGFFVEGFSGLVGVGEDAI